MHHYPMCCEDICNGHKIEGLVVSGSAQMISILSDPAHIVCSCHLEAQRGLEPFWIPSRSAPRELCRGGDIVSAINALASNVGDRPMSMLVRSLAPQAESRTLRADRSMLR